MTKWKWCGGIALRGLAALGTVWFIARGVHWREVSDDLRVASFWPLVGVVSLNGIVMAIKAVRLQLLVGRARVSIRSCFLMLLTSSAINNIMPLRGGDLARLWMLERRAGITKTAAVAITLVERLFELLTLAGLVALVSLFLPGQRWARMAAPIFFAAACLALVALSSWTRRPQSLLSASALPSVQGRIRRWLEAAALRFSLGVSSLGMTGLPTRAIWLSALGWGCETVMVVWCGRALGLPISMALGAIVLFGVNIAIAIPAGPASVGTFEGAMVIVLTLAGVAKSSAVAFALLYHALLVVPVKVAGVVIDLRLGVASSGAPLSPGMSEGCGETQHG